MFRKRILEYFDKRMLGIVKLYPVAIEGLEPDAVHDLRVHLKRTRALFNLLEDLNPSFRAKKQFKPFRAISQATRELRDVQVQLDLLRKLSRRLRAEPGSFRRYLLDYESAAAEVFRDSDTPDRLTVLEGARSDLEETLNGLSGESASSRAEARFHGLKADTLELACRAVVDEQIMHELRTVAKQTHYTFEIASRLGRLRTERRFVGRVKCMHGLLGDWHDREVAFIYLDRFLKKEGSRSLDSTLGRLAEILRRDKERLALACRGEIEKVRALAAAPGGSLAREVQGGGEPAPDAGPPEPERNS